MRLLHSNGTSQMIKEPTGEAQRLNQNGALDQYNDLNPQSRNPAIARVKGQRPYKGEAWGGWCMWEIWNTKRLNLQLLSFKMEDESHDPKNYSIFQKLEHNCQVITECECAPQSTSKRNEIWPTTWRRIEMDLSPEPTTYFVYRNHKIMNCFLKAVALWW